MLFISVLIRYLVGNKTELNVKKYKVNSLGDKELVQILATSHLGATLECPDALDGLPVCNPGRSDFHSMSIKSIVY